jgi:hypothetical protein
MKERNSRLSQYEYEEIQKHIRGEVADQRFSGYELEFMQHIGNMTPEQFEQELRDASISFHAGIDPRPRVQVPTPELETILEYGYKTTHEIRSDHSLRPIRLPYEASIGIHPSTPANLRPASGYIVHKDWMETELKAAAEVIESENLEDAFPELLQSQGRLADMREGRGPVNLYGGIEVVLRPEVAERTRYLEGDSLNTKGIPTPMVGNDIDSVQYALFGGTERRDMVTELLYGHWKGDHGASRRHMMMMSPPGFGAERPIRVKKGQYMEALIAGSFDSGDVEEVVIDSMEYIPLQWIDQRKPQQGRKQQVYGGVERMGQRRMEIPALAHLDDENKLIEKLGFTPAEAKIAKEVAKEYLVAGEDAPGVFREEFKVFAVLALQDTLQKKGIKLTVKTRSGRDVFDPKTLFPEAGDGATAEEALTMRVEARIRAAVRERIAEAGREAQKAASSNSDTKERAVA